MSSERFALTSVLAVTFIIAVTFAHDPARAVGASFAEAFDSTARRDLSATTVVWDTEKHETRIPFDVLSWESLSGLKEKSVAAVTCSSALSPETNSFSIFAGLSDGIYRSINDGSSWARVAVMGQPVTSVALSPAFSGDGTGFAVTSGDGVWRTINSGDSWSKIREGSGLDIALSPAFVADHTAFIALLNGVAKSTDGGTTWTVSTAGMDPEVVERGDVRAIAISPNYASDQTVYATTFSFGVYRSNDGGATWSVVNPEGVEVVGAAAIAVGVDGRVAVSFLDGAYLSADRGVTWTKISDADVADIVFASDGAVILATATGVVRWHSSGGSTALTQGWPVGAAQAVALAPTTVTTVIAGRADGLQRTHSSYRASATAVSTNVTTISAPITSATLTAESVTPAGTSIVYHLSVAEGADGEPVWEGPVTLGVVWKFARAGLSLRWRATLATTVPATYTPKLTKLIIAYEALSPPITKGIVPGVTTLQWKFEGTASDATSYELHTMPDDRVVPVRREGLFLIEQGLTPNTEYCGRHIHALVGEMRSPASAAYPCAVTYAAIPAQPGAAEITSSSALISFNSGANPSDTEYAIKETVSMRFVGADGMLASEAPVWQRRAAWENGSVRVRGLTLETSYSFCLMARNRVRVETECSPPVTVRTSAATAEGQPPVQPPTNKSPPIGEQPPTNVQPPINAPPSSGERPPTNTPPPDGGAQPPTNTPPGGPLPGGGSDGGGGGGGATAPIVPAPPPALTVEQPRLAEITNAPMLMVRGSAPAGVSVSFTIDGVGAGATTPDVAGVYASVLRIIELPDGQHVLGVSSVSGGSALTVTVPFTIDRTPLAPPQSVKVALPTRMASSVTGLFNVTIEFSGSLTPEEFAQLDVLLITVTSEPVTLTFRPTSPNWTFRTTIALAPGTHTARVAARDLAGNVSPQPNVITFEVARPECSDGIDNDSDGFIDYPGDPDCTNPDDDREAREGVFERAVSAVQTQAGTAARAVAQGTKTAAVVTARTAERASVVVQERVLDNPTVEVATERMVAPAVTVAVAATTATAVPGIQLFAYFQHLIGLLLQPGRLLSRRKRRGWGTVYASISKRPIDLVTVRLLDATTGRVVQTDVTDHLGRFGFIVERPGAYRIEAHHPQHLFPATTLDRRKEDAAFVDLYYGDTFNVTETGGLITVNIPLDAKEEAEKPPVQIVKHHYLRLLSNGISNAGLVTSIVSFGISPRPYVAAILATNLLLFFLFRRLVKRIKRPKSWGAVTDVITSRPLHLSVVRIFDQQFNKLLENTVTDRYGRYSFLVGKNVYYVTAQKSGYVTARSQPIDLTKQEGVVGVDLGLKPAPGPQLRTGENPEETPVLMAGGQ